MCALDLKLQFIQINFSSIISEDITTLVSLIKRHSQTKTARKMNVRSLANAVPGNSKIETLIGKWAEVAEQAFYAFLRNGVLCRFSKVIFSWFVRV